MELIIILVVIVVVSAVVYFQLKGSKPEVLTVSDLTVPYKRKEKKESKTEKKVEQWDKPEVVKRDSSPTEKKRNRKDKMFDPVKEGLKVVSTPKVVDETPVALTQKEEKANKKRLEADGFVVVKEKKAPQGRPAEAAAAEPEPVEEEQDLSPAAQHIALLKSIIAGNRPTGPRPDRDSSPSQNTGPRKTPANREVSREDIEKKLQKDKEESQKKKEERSRLGGRVLSTGAPMTSKGWTKAEVAAPAPVEEKEPEAEPEINNEEEGDE